MAAIAQTGTAGPRRQPAGQRSTGRWTIMPATYLVAIVALGLTVVALVALVALGLTVVPLLLVVVNGFRTNADINANAAGLPSPWVAGNYTAILQSAAFWQLIGNSTLVSVVATALVLVLGTMAALALSQYQFKGREFFYNVFVAGLL